MKGMKQISQKNAKAKGVRCAYALPFSFIQSVNDGHIRIPR